MRKVMLIAVLLVACGCQQPSYDQLQLDRVLTTIEKISQKAIEETDTTTASFQGGLHGVEPGWKVVSHGVVGYGFTLETEVYLKGVAGQISGATQAASSQPAEGGDE